MPVWNLQYCDTNDSGNENVHLLNMSCGCIALWSIMTAVGEETAEQMEAVTEHNWNPNMTDILKGCRLESAAVPVWKYLSVTSHRWYLAGYLKN